MKNTYIENIYKNVKFIYNNVSYDIYSKKYNLVPDEINSTLINQLKSTQNTLFSYSFILKYFNTPNKMYLFKTKNITLYVIYKRNIDLSFIKETLKRCEIIIDIYKIQKHFDIKLIYSPYKKIIPKKGLLTSKHINSAYTYINSNDVYIVRKEEHEKVMIHEILHHVKSIQNDNWSQKNIADLKEHFNISKDCQLIPNEGVIELWALIYNSIFVSLYEKKSFKKILQSEINHSIKNSNTIFNLQETYKDKIWNERSNVFCYIVIKTILLYNLKNLFKIYSFPYNTDVITRYIIDNSNHIKKNTNNINKKMTFTLNANSTSLPD